MQLGLRRYVIAISLALVMAAMPAAPAADGGDVVDDCYTGAGGIPVVGLKTCRSAQAFIFGFGRFCRFIGGSDVCTNVDGRSISAAMIDDFEGSWVSRALALQRWLDDDVPMSRELWVHTHNSFNAEAYDATFSGLDSNQIYSLTDQLRMGVRAIEIDLHWAPHVWSIEELQQYPDVVVADQGRAPIVCHGRSEGSGPVRFHFGCTAEVHLRTRLGEVRDWLLRPENAGEVLMLYLENQLDSDPVAHSRAVEAIEGTLGDFIYRPTNNTGCQSLPVQLSRSQIRSVGRVILTGNCGPSGSSWNDTVFERGSGWTESKSNRGIDYPDYPACISSERVPKNYDNKFIRFYEDSTWLSAMVEGSSLGSTGEIYPEEARRMVRCGVNLPGFDQLQPLDGRLEAVVWSWASDEPPLVSTGKCAFAGSDGRFYSDDCTGGTDRKFACATSSGWALTTTTGSWSEGAGQCAALNATFAVPRGGYENELLKEVKGAEQVWLAYRFDSGAGTWLTKTS